MTSSILAWSIVALLVFWAVGAYNRLVRLRSEVNASFSQVQGQMQQLAQLALSLAAPTDPQEAEDEPAFLGQIRAASAQLVACLEIQRPKPLDHERLRSLQRGDRAVSGPASGLGLQLQARTSVLTLGTNAATAPPLWRLLQATAGVVQAVGEGASATPALAAVPAPLRAGTQALVFQALRQMGRAQALRALIARRAPPAPADALLRTALALCWDPAQAPYEPFTLVNQAVEAAKQQRSTAGQASFINACLRRFLREREALVAQTEGSPRKPCSKPWPMPASRRTAAATTAWCSRGPCRCTRSRASTTARSRCRTQRPNGRPPCCCKAWCLPRASG